MSPGEAFARELLSSWERTVASFSNRVVRDPRILEAGAAWLRAALEWKRAQDQIVDEMLTRGVAVLRAGAGPECRP